MDNIRVIIIEDEIHNSRILEGMMKNLRPEWKIEAILESVQESVNWLESNEAPDLILMDIQLSDGISFSIFNKYELESKTKIIFTTAYDQYAIRAFKVNSVDYLLKPIKEEELEQALEKFELNSKNNQNASFQDFSEDKDHYKKMINAILEGKENYRTRFLICGIRDYTKLETKDIAYFYSSNKTTFAVTFEGEEHILDYTLEQLETELNPAHFYRVNRQVLLHVDTVKKVSNISGNKLKVVMLPDPGFEVTVSRLKASDFKKWLGK